MLAGCLLPAAAQEPMQPLPIDPQVRYGKLDNGLTYYLRHNTQPKDRADFYIAQRVGSMQEEDSQSGLAHFLEHMAFNGTRNFPGKKLSDYLETIGVRFGENLNAYTGFDQTVYMIQNVPTTRPGIVDSCLLILHDWSNAISLEDEEIDKERGVIHEEWRTRNNAAIRLLEQQLPALLPGSKYADRLPIGKMEIVDNFPYDTLRNYYKKWYRPDLQAVIVVGDIDVDRVENELKKIFAHVPAPVNPAVRERYPVPDNDRPLVSVATDKEATGTLIRLYYKHKVLPSEMYATPAGAIRDYIRLVLAEMANSRLSELTQKPDAPFVQAGALDTKYLVAQTKDAWTLATMAKEGAVEEALAALVRENQRIKQYGFTPAEYERARTKILKQYEKIYNERDKHSNNQYVQEYVAHFNDGGYIPGIEAEYELLRAIASHISENEVNQYIQSLITDKNVAIALSGPEKEGVVYPTADELLRMYYQAEKQEVTPYEETVSDEPLVGQLPAPGKIVSVRENPSLGTTELVLSNGVKVNLKKTDFKKDEIFLTATSPGGTSLFDTSDKVNYQLMNAAVARSGIGNLSSVDLKKRLAGKMLSISTSVGPDGEKINGAATPADLETLFQLIYLTFNGPRKDTAAYQSFIQQLGEQLRSQEANPMVSFNDTLNVLLYDRNPRTQRLTADALAQADYDRMLEMYGERFGDASDFVFTLVGNVTLDSVKPYLEQYLATLPAGGRKEEADRRNAVRLHRGKAQNRFRRPLETPKASVVNIYPGRMDYTLENLLAATMLEQILDIVYTEKVREDEGGTYGVNTALNISSFPEGETDLEVYFNTDPAKFEKLNRIVQTELARIVEEGPRETDFNKTKENMLKKRAEALQENRYWLDILDQYYSKGFDRHTRYDEALQAITPATVQAFAKQLLSQGNHVEIVMLPEETGPAPAPSQQ